MESLWRSIYKCSARRDTVTEEGGDGEHAACSMCMTIALGKKELYPEFFFLQARAYKIHHEEQVCLADKGTGIQMGAFTVGEI